MPPCPPQSSNPPKPLSTVSSTISPPHSPGRRESRRVSRRWGLPVLPLSLARESPPSRLPLRMFALRFARVSLSLPMPPTLFDPAEEILDSLLDDLASPNLSLTDIALNCGTTVEALSAWLATDGATLLIQHSLHAATLRTRLAATHALPSAVQALVTALTDYSKEEYNAGRESSADTPFTREHRRTSARRAAQLLTRLANFTPRSTEPYFASPRPFSSLSRRFDGRVDASRGGEGFSSYPSSTARESSASNTSSAAHTNGTAPTAPPTSVAPPPTQSRGADVQPAATPSIPSIHAATQPTSTKSAVTPPSVKPLAPTGRQGNPPPSHVFSTPIHPQPHSRSIGTPTSPPAWPANSARTPAHTGPAP